MITKIRTLSRARFKDEWPIKDTCAISISSVGYASPAKPSSNVLPLYFDDCSPKSVLVQGFGIEAMSKRDALDIWYFLELFHSMDKEYTLVTHCDAGICRSGAVSAFAQFKYKTDESDFNMYNSHILPNVWIYNLLCMTELEG